MSFHWKSEHLNRLLLVLDLATSAFVFLLILNLYEPAGRSGPDIAAHVGLLIVLLI